MTLHISVGRSHHRSLEGSEFIIGNRELNMGSHQEGLEHRTPCAHRDYVRWAAAVY